MPCECDWDIERFRMAQLSHPILSGFLVDPNGGMNTS